MRFTEFNIGLVILAALFSSPAAWADYGVIETSNGKTYRGSIQTTAGGFIVSNTNGNARVDLQQLARLRIKAQSTDSHTNAEHGLRASYFSNSDCSGERVVRIDPSIDFSWPDGYPVPGIGPVDFSVRWEGKLQPPATGKYTFYAQCDGVKLWIDNEAVLDKTDTAAGVETSGNSIQLHEGKLYTFKMELYNRSMGASVRLFWTGPGFVAGIVPKDVFYAIPLDPTDGAQKPKCGLMGIYYPTTNFTGESTIRFDREINFDWGEDPPLESMTAESYCVRWLAYLMPEHSEAYTFKIEAENGARLWLNGNLIIDLWKEEPVSGTSVPIFLRAGEKCDLRVEMFSSRGAGKAKLLWSSRSTPEQVIPSACLVPTSALERDQRASQSEPIPPGVRLATGTFVASPIQSADETCVKLGGPAGETQISLVNVARIVFQPLTPESSVRLVAGRSGLLLKNNDFVEGEYRGIANGQIRIDSVLFGVKTYLLKDVLALNLCDVKQVPTPYEVRLRNGSVFRANKLEIADESILIQDSILKGCKLAMGDLLEIGHNQ